VPDDEAEAGEPAGQPGTTARITNWSRRHDRTWQPSNYGQYDDHVYFTSTRLAGGAWAYDAIEARLDTYDEESPACSRTSTRSSPPARTPRSDQRGKLRRGLPRSQSRHPLRVIREVPYIYDPHPGAEIAAAKARTRPMPAVPPGNHRASRHRDRPDGGRQPTAGATGEPERQARETGPTDVLAGQRTAVTRQIIDLAPGRPRPHLDEDGPRSGAQGHPERRGPRRALRRYLHRQLDGKDPARVLTTQQRTRAAL